MSTGIAQRPQRQYRRQGRRLQHKGYSMDVVRGKTGHSIQMHNTGGPGMVRFHWQEKLERQLLGTDKACQPQPLQVTPGNDLRSAKRGGNRVYRDTP